MERERETFSVCRCRLPLPSSLSVLLSVCFWLPPLPHHAECHRVSRDASQMKWSPLETNRPESPGRESQLYKLCQNIPFLFLCLSCINHVMSLLPSTRLCQIPNPRGLRRPCCWVLQKDPYSRDTLEQGWVQIKHLSFICVLHKSTVPTLWGFTLL